MRQLIFQEPQRILYHQKIKGPGVLEVQALTLESSTKAWTPDGDLCRVWQAVSQPEFVTELLKASKGVINRKSLMQQYLAHGLQA